jgi:hypothetical protein
VAPRQRRQGGQILVLVSLLFAALAGFLGLVIDGGGVAAQQQLVRNAADGAALAGGYAIFRQGSTLAAATTAAQKAVGADGLAVGDLTMAYLDAGGTATPTPALVRTVQASVSDARPTMFLRILGIATTQIAASAQVAGSPGAAAPCAVCAMSATTTGVSVANQGRLNITGASLIVNSTAGPNISVGIGATLSAPAIVEAGGPPSNSGTITPTPTTGAAVADPHPTAPVPAVAGSAVAYTASGATPSIAPGVYSGITVAAGSSLTLSAGVYVLTGPINMSGGSISGSGVMIYLACSAYPTACPVAGSGAHFNLSGGTLTLSPPTSGTYAGMAVFGDRNNGATNVFSRATVSVTGTWYTVRMPLSNTHNGDTLNLGETVAASVAVANNSVVTVAYVQSQSYGGGPGSGPLSLSL